MDFAKYHFNPFQFTPGEDLLLDAHARHVPFFRGCRQVLDLGAGRGLFLRELAKVSIRGIGVENHAESIESGRSHDVRYFEADMFEFFSRPDGRELAASCDGVYCCFVLEHLDPKQVFELLRAIKEHCAPNVRCRFITHNPEDIDALGTCLYGDLTHKRLYVPSVLAAMARSQGFVRTEFATFLGMKLGKKDTLRRMWDRLFWGKHKWRPNFYLDCFA
ncbi:MAG: class I SAM-dependent methyltransferase [Verrucomicrobia bacterium]|nr:class I SAM-dependent methyltransferase [Verrucomicrobiota bacterium]